MNKNKKVLLVVILSFLAIAGIAFFVLKNQVSDPSSSEKASESINFDPPTKEDKQRAADNKERLAKEQSEKPTIDEPSTDGPTVKSVKPVITYAGQYEGEVQVGAYVTGELNNTGICTATLTQGSLQLTKEVQAMPNVNSMDCPEMAFSRPEFTSTGKWNVTVKYKSSTSEGTSDAREIEVK